MMSNGTIIFEFVLGLLIYAGPVFPLGATLVFRRASVDRFRSNCKLLLILVSIHFLAFLPYVFAVVAGNPDSLHALSLPFGVGALMFTGTLIYLLIFAIRYLLLPHLKHD